MDPGFATRHLADAARGVGRRAVPGAPSGCAAGARRASTGWHSTTVRPLSAMCGIRPRTTGHRRDRPPTPRIRSCQAPGASRSRTVTRC